MGIYISIYPRDNQERCVRKEVDGGTFFPAAHLKRRGGFHHHVSAAGGG